MDRIRETSEWPEDQLLARDYFVISTLRDSWAVSSRMAQHVEACIDATPAARWVRFVDLAGARVRLATRWIESVAQCTAEQRDVMRAFRRAREQEARQGGSADNGE
jgi:hypothetical protein